MKYIFENEYLNLKLVIISVIYKNELKQKYFFN